MDGSFSATFDAWVLPNSLNSILMTAYSGFRGYTNTGGLGTEIYTVSGYIDPTITIDAIYGNQYTMNVSNIPTVAVPEPSSYGMLLVGMAAIASVARRRKAKRK